MPARTAGTGYSEGPNVATDARLRLTWIRSYLKKVFWPNFCVGPLFQLLGILQYACGLKLGPALNLNQNPFFEMASSVFVMNETFLRLASSGFSFVPGRVSKRNVFALVIHVLGDPCEGIAYYRTGWRTHPYDKPIVCLPSLGGYCFSWIHRF